MQHYAHLLSWGTLDYTSFMVLLAGPALLGAIGVLLVLLLRNGAKRSADGFRAYLLSPGGGSTGMLPVPRDECLARLDGMVYWPIDYMKPNQLATVFALAVVTLVFYRIGSLLCGAVFFVVLYRAITGLLEARQ